MHARDNLAFLRPMTGCARIVNMSLKLASLTILDGPLSIQNLDDAIFAAS